MDKKKPVSLSWDVFQSMGNPENAPDEPVDNENENGTGINNKSSVRIYKEKKKRGGKAVSVIKGIDADAEYLKKLTKEIKVKLGVGGHLDGEEIIIQGTNREKIMEMLISKGYKNTKLAGA